MKDKIEKVLIDIEVILMPKMEPTSVQNAAQDDDEKQNR